MHFSTATVLSVLAITSSVLAGPLRVRDSGDDSNSDINIFPSADKYDDWAICKGKVTKGQFPNLQAPTNDGGCVVSFASGAPRLRGPLKRLSDAHANLFTEIFPRD
jgi:hypothetical protein